MLELITTISASEFNDMINTATMLGVFMGIGLGMIVTGCFIYILEKGRQKNFKIWMNDLPGEDRIQIKNKLNDLYPLVNELATKSNTKLFKSMHNSLVRLKSFLATKWMQE